MTTPTDADLVSLTRDGDRDAYGALVARYQGHVYGLAYSLVGNWTDAQDIAQETFIRAYVNLDQLRDPARFAAWLRRVTFSVAMNWLKAYRPRLFQHFEGRVDLESLEIPDFRPGPAEVAERRELAQAVQGAIASLPPKYRVPLTMFHLDGLSYQKVADFLDIPLGRVKVLIHRARAKLKTLLPAHLAEELSPAVQEVFNEHKLPAEFAQKVLDNVPTLAWGTGRECTFAGALEAALAATEHPYKYADLMGFTGLAFRVRWFCGNEDSRWCPSCAVGEMGEEIEAAAKATGWPLRVAFLSSDDESSVTSVRDEIVASINAGRAVPAYNPDLNMAVVYGYEEGGQALLLRDYGKVEEPLRLPPSELGFMSILLGEHVEPTPRREAVIESLHIALRNQRRERAAAGPGEYWYGKAALDHWRADIAQAGRVPEKDRGWLFFVSWWNFETMHDARKVAVTYLDEAAAILDGEAAEALKRAASVYRQEFQMLDQVMANGDAFLGPWTGKSAEDWSAPVRRREQEVLARVREMDEAAAAEIEQALRSIESR